VPEAVRESNATLRGVSCQSSSYCLAVGSTGANPLAEFWNGSTWVALTQPPVPSSYQSAILNGISCVSTTWCLAAGYYKNSSGLGRPFADIWNGSSWATTPGVPWGENIEGFAYGVSCVSTSECWVVGNGQSGSLRKPWGALWTGTTWAIGAFPLAPGSEGAYLRGVTCTATNECQAVGSSLFGGEPIGLVETLTP
jgi:hypothetical protein